MSSRTVQSFIRGSFALLALLAWCLSPVAHAQTTQPSNDRFDLTHNGVINDADAWEVIEAWNDLQEDGLCFAPEQASRDINGDGCIDVADVQLVLSHWGERTTSAVALRATTSAAGSTFVVNSTGDDSDTAPGDGVCRTSAGVCTLRAAAQESSAHPGRDTIAFNIRNPDGACPSGPSVIRVNSTLDTMILLDDYQGAGTVIDGYTQCGASPNTDALNGNASIKIEVVAVTYTDRVFGLKIVSQNNVIRGLAVYNWDVGVMVTDNAATGNIVEGNFLGTNAAQTFSLGERGDGKRGNGVNIRYYAANNTIGGSAPAARNIISGNPQDGMATDETAMSNRIVGNYVGLKQDGVTILPNKSDGLDLNIGSSNNVIGGLGPGERNVISGNNHDGIEISHSRPGKMTTGNKVIGNYIGLSAYGGAVQDANGVKQPWGNGSTGLTLEDTIDGTEAYGNYFSGNGHDGVRLYSNSTNTYIHDNVIGLTPDGSPMSNGGNANLIENYRGDGIWIMGDSRNNVIARNVITNSKGNGILISNWADPMYSNNRITNFNTLSQNTIYNNAGVGIAFDADGGIWPNQNIRQPTITDARTGGVSGTTCANCKVELFLADTKNTSANGEGKTFVGSGTADASGRFTIQAQGLAKDQVLTGTATDPSGNTSMFARNVVVKEGAPLPPPIPTSTPVPSPTPSPIPSPTPKGTPIPTRTPQPAPTNKTWLPLVHSY